MIIYVILNKDGSLKTGGGSSTKSYIRSFATRKEAVRSLAGFGDPNAYIAIFTNVGGMK